MINNSIFPLLNIIDQIARNSADMDKLEGNVYRPECSVEADDETCKLYIDLPGVDRADIDVEMNQGVLTLKAVRKVPKEEKYEFRYGIRTDKYDTEQAKLAYNNGVLTVTVPARVTAKPQKLQIE